MAVNSMPLRFTPRNWTIFPDASTKVLPLIEIDMVPGLAPAMVRSLRWEKCLR